MIKPSKEQYGWHTQSGVDDEATGWLIEGGEQAYDEAMAKWTSLQDKSENLKKLKGYMKIMKLLNDKEKQAELLGKEVIRLRKILDSFKP